MECVCTVFVSASCHKLKSLLTWVLYNKLKLAFGCIYFHFQEKIEKINDLVMYK